MRIPREPAHTLLPVGLSVVLGLAAAPASSFAQAGPVCRLAPLVAKVSKGVPAVLPAGEESAAAPVAGRPAQGESLQRESGADPSAPQTVAVTRESGPGPAGATKTHSEEQSERQAVPALHRSSAAHDDPSDEPDEQDGQHDQHDEHGGGEGEGGHGHSSRISEELIPLQLDGFPKRPKPILELGEPFLGTGTLGDGVKLPTGAVWQPSLLAFGSLRTAVQTFDDGTSHLTEAVVRLDLFGNLYLSGTERLVVGFRNFDRDGRFTRSVLDTDRLGVEEGFQDELNAEVTSLFFEGDFGEIFPNISRNDFGSTDWGFSVGRQPLLFQEGLVLNDSIDAVGITRNTLLPNGTSNFRMTFLYGWGDVDRTDDGLGRRNVEDRTADLFAVLTSTDFRWSTMDVDAAYVASDFGDLANLGISAVQRIGKMASSFRVAGSFTNDELQGPQPGQSRRSAASDGLLLFSELSWTPHRTHDLLYFNAFAAIDDYRSAARDPATGGPLGRAGINFAAVGLGSYGSPLSNQARDVAGGAVGYQHFWNHTRTQFLVELGTRFGIEDTVANQAAVTGRFQQALRQHFVLILDAFVGYQESLISGASNDTLFGGRVELLTKF